MGLSSSKKRNRRAKRDASAIANPLSLPSLASLLRPNFSSLSPISSPKPKNLRPVEDRRTYHPQGKVRPARSLQKSQHKLVARPSSVQGVRSTPARTAPPVHVGFHAPKKVLVCIRRQTRKQVLFALRKTGKGAKRRKHRWSYYSSIRC